MLVGKLFVVCVLHSLKGAHGELLPLAGTSTTTSTSAPTIAPSLHSSAVSGALAGHQTALRCLRNGGDMVGDRCSCPRRREGLACELPVCEHGERAELSTLGGHDSTCHCSPFYTGAYCSEVASCYAGRLTHGRCVCSDHYYGQVCDTRCVHGKWYNGTCMCFRG